jgi:hypothetical protein
MMRLACRILVGQLVINLGADERIILKSFLKRQGVIVWSGFVFIGKGTSCGLL